MIERRKKSLIQDLTQKDSIRLEAFSDNVFAIAISILVLNIRVPPAVSLKRPLLDELLKQWPMYVSLLIGFFTILVCWINHHHICRFVQKSDSNMMIINSLTLLTVIFVPFSTSILAEYLDKRDSHTAITIYAFTFFMMALSYNLMWRYAYKRRFTKQDTNRIFLRATKNIYNIWLLYTIIAMIVSFFSVIASLALYALMFGVYSFPERFAHKLSKYIKG